MILWSDVLWTLLAAAGMVISALCAGAEMGAYAVNRVRLSLRAEAGQRRAVCLRVELERGPRFLAAILIGFNVFAYLGALAMTTLLQRAGYGELGIVLLNVLVIGPVLFVVVDTLPKEVFRAEPDRLMYALAWPLRAWRLLLTALGVLPLVQGAARAMAALIPGEGEQEAVETARQRMAVLLKEGARHGAISAAQASMVDRALALREAQVGDEMVPWSRVQTVGADWDAARLLGFVRSHTLSRFPVVDTRGGVMGLIEHLDVSLNPGRSAGQLLKPIATLQSQQSVPDGLLALRAHGARLAVVYDRGRPAGIVTGRDLCEPLTGELRAW